MGAAKKVLRITTILAGVLLFIISIIRFVKVSSFNFSQVLLSIYMM